MYIPKKTRTNPVGSQKTDETKTNHPSPNKIKTLGPSKKNEPICNKTKPTSCSMFITKLENCII